MSQPRGIPGSGRFNCWTQGFDLPDLLVAMCATGKTGELRFKSAEATKAIVMKDGAIVFAKSSAMDDRLDSYLLKRNQIRFEHVVKLGRFVAPGKRFGTVLVEHGVLDGHGLVDAVIGQVRSIVLSLFSWTESDYAFEAKALAKETIQLRIPLHRLVLQGVCGVRNWRRVAHGIGSLDVVYRTSPGIEESLRGIQLEPAEKALFTKLKSPVTIAEACAGTDAADFRVCQILWGFLALGWIEPAAHEASKAPAELPSPEEAESSEPSDPPLQAAATSDPDLHGLDVTLGGGSSHGGEPARPTPTITKTPADEV